MKYKSLVGMLWLTLLTGCLSDDYMDKAISDTIVATPGVAVPIANAKTDVHDLISKSTNKVMFYTDGAGINRVVVYMQEDSIKRFGINDLYAIPPANIAFPVLFTALDGGPVTLQDSVSFNVSNGYLQTVTAKISYGITATNFPYPVNLKITLNDVSSPTQNPVSISTVLAAGDTYQLDSILNATAQLKNNKFPIKLEISKVNGASSSSNIGNLTITSNIGNLTYAKGVLWQTALAIDEGSYNINLGVFKQDPGVIYFDDPSMMVTSTNSTPFGAIIAPWLIGVNSTTTDSVTLTTTPFAINERISATEARYDTASFTRANSNIGDFLNISPDKLVYSGGIIINPGGENSGLVEMSQNDAVFLGYRLNFPLSLTVTNLATSDTIDFGGTDLTKNMEAGIIVLNSTNKMPLQAKSVLKLCDDMYNVLDTLNLELLKEAPIDNNGLVIEDQVKAVYEEKKIEGDRLMNLRNTTKMILETTLSTSEYQTNKIVVIQEQNSLNIQIGLKAQINTTL